MNNKKNLNALVGEILDLQAKHKETKEELEKTRQDLQTKIKQEVEVGRVGDHPKLTQKILELEGRLKALQEVEAEKRKEAEGLIRDERPQYQKKAAEVEKEIKQVKRKADTHMVQAVVEFCHEWGFNIEWPTQFNGGVIKVGAVSLPGNEVISIADKFKEKKRVLKREEEELRKLHAELLRLEMLDGPPSEALNHALMIRRDRVR